MNSDRELLEMAAKAADTGPLDFDYAKREGHGYYFGPRLPMSEGVLMAAMWTYWRPLEDDGDALRLAVKLGLRIEFCRSYVACYSGSCMAQQHTQFKGDDPLAATRRAIVRAAAEIGRNMP